MGFLSLAVLCLFASNALSNQATSLAVALKDAQLGFYAPQSKEATVTFESDLLIPPEKTGGAPTNERSRRFIEWQLKYLYGPLQFSSETFKAGPKRDHKIQVLGKERIQDDKGAPVYRVRYSYRGTLVANEVPGNQLKLYLPLQSDAKFYESGMKDGTNFCTDPRYQGEGDYWYFWSPNREGCPMKEGVDYREIPAKLEWKKNTSKTYPEYSRLIQTEKGSFWKPDSKQVHVFVLMGLVDAERTINPQDGDDYWSENEYAENVENFKALGFIKEKYSRVQDNDHLVELWSKKYESGEEVLLHLFYGVTSSEHLKSKVFQRFWKYALEDGSIIFYYGHSGLGGNLDLKTVEENVGPVRIPKERYQMMFMDGCSTYSYYNNSYFDRKKTELDPSGTKNLDIFTNGIEGGWDSQSNDLMVVLESVDDYLRDIQVRSYQEILDQISVRNYLQNVNGDEDNPTVPEKIKK